MGIVAVLLVFALIYALLHPLRTLGLIFRLAASIVVLIIILVIAGAIIGDPQH